EARMLLSPPARSCRGRAHAPPARVLKAREPAVATASYGGAMSKHGAEQRSRENRTPRLPSSARRFIRLQRVAHHRATAPASEAPVVPRHLHRGSGDGGTVHEAPPHRAGSLYSFTRWRDGNGQGA